MSVLELYIEKDVAGGSIFHSANSLTSCGNNLSNNEAEPPRNVSNLHGDEDDGDDDYLVSNSYVEESLDENDSVDGISNTDDEATDMIQPVRIVHPVEDMIREDPSIKVSLIQERINSEFAYKVSYKKAWMTKQKAIAIEYGNWEESYAKLSSWLTNMQNHSSGSYFQILHDDFIVGNTVSREHRQFHRVFWTFDQCKKAFKYCKSIIQVDDTHLYEKYRGTLLMATSQDGNGGALPLAFVVVEALGWQPPHGYHVYCVRHIASNFNHKFNNVKQKEMLKKLACGYVNMNYYQYIDVVYTNEHILKAYSAQWWSLGNEATISPSDDAWTLIPGPTTIRAKGRPKSTRIRNEMD
ncbi:hypothetical protein HKD37_18G050432 [Glycine soja]